MASPQRSSTPPHGSSAGHPSLSPASAKSSASPSLHRTRSSSLLRLPKLTTSTPATTSSHDPDLARPTALSLRPHLLSHNSSQNQTRIRARSVTSGHNQAGLQDHLREHLRSHLSPTIPGSPVLPLSETFLVGSSVGDGTERGAKPATDEDRASSSSDETDGNASTAPSSEDYDPASWPSNSSKGHSDTQYDPPPSTAKLDKSSRMGVRRGKSFTSLLMPSSAGATPTYEKTHEDILEEEASSLSPLNPHHDLESSFPPSKSTDPLLSPLETSLEGPPKTLKAFLPEVGIIALLFSLSFAFIFFLISTLPHLFIPHSLSSLPDLTASLSKYASQGPVEQVHLFSVLTALFLWKQCFSIPGSVLTNVLFGALYGTAWGTWWACVWTAVGSTGAYAIAKLVAPLVEHYFATPLALTRRTLHITPTEPNPPDLFSHLLLARLFPLLPYSVLNVISGVLHLPLPSFFLSLVLGSFPFNFSTCSIGALVSLSISSSQPLGETLWSKEVIIKLVLVSLVSGIPVVFKERLKKLLSSGAGWGSWGRSVGLSNVSAGGGRLSRRVGSARRKWNRSWVGVTGGSAGDLRDSEEGGDVALD